MIEIGTQTTFESRNSAAYKRCLGFDELIVVHRSVPGRLLPGFDWGRDRDSHFVYFLPEEVLKNHRPSEGANVLR